MEELYRLFTWGTAWVTLAFGLTLLFMRTPNKQKLANYIHVKHIMGWTFLLISFSNAYEASMLSTFNSVWFPRLLILTTACLLSLILTSTSVTLIESAFMSKKILLKKIIFFVCISTITLNCLIYFPETKFFYIVYYLFVLYVILLFRKSINLFYRKYNLYKKRREEYYSERKQNQLKWVQTSYYSAIAMGGISLLSLASPLWWMVIFSIIVIVFYTYYGIRILSYGSTFEIYEAVVDNTEPQISKLPTLTFDQIELALNKWEANKMYTKSNITIETVASELNTNRTYLSSYINMYKEKSFREWINDLRIVEAQKLLKLNKTLTVSEVGELVGITDKSNFGRQFTKRTGVTPLVWRNSNCIQ